MRFRRESPQKFKPNLTEANQFLDAISACSPVTFQTFSDQRDGECIDHLAKIFPNPSTEPYGELEALQRKGAGIFIMVNEGDGKGRRTKNVIRIKAVFVDLDGAPLQPVFDAELAPHIIVESSPARYHAYWLVSDCPLDKFSVIQKALAVKFDSDKSVHDLCRVMRLPGFYHLKNPIKPFLTKIHTIRNDLTPYNLKEIMEKLTVSSQIDENSNYKNAGGCTPPSLEMTFEWVDNTTGEIHNLKKWATNHRGFKLAEALRTRKPEVIQSNPIDGKQHIRCVNQSMHTGSGVDNGTFVMDPQDSETMSFVYHCRHSHCTDLDRLHAIKMMLEKGWLTWSDLIGRKFNIIKEQVHPRYVEFSSDELMGLLHLLPSTLEKQLYLYLGIHSILNCNRGIIPNHDKRIAAVLGITSHQWTDYKLNWNELGIIVVEEACIFLPYFQEKYQYAVGKYIEASINGSRGGNKKRNNSTPPRETL